MDAIWNFGDGVRDVFDVSSDDYRNVGSRATPEHQHHHLIILEVVKLHHNVVYKKYVGCGEQQ
jgi:hypothetical protein